VLLNGPNKMDKQPLVSIIMNCFNGEEFLKEALDSIQNQTYNNWELIFWDNQSTDNSKNIFESYSDPRFKYHYAQEHHNLYTARNLAISVSKGEFIAFLDTDDTWIPKKLEIQLPHFEDPIVGLVYGNYWIHYQNSNKNRIIYLRHLPSGNILKYLLRNYVVGLVTIILRKSFYEALEKKFDPRMPLSGDFDFVIRFALNNTIVAVQKPLAYYRWHGNNYSNLHIEKQIAELELWYEEMLLNNNFSSIRELSSVKNFINFLKAKRCLEQKEYYRGVKYFFKLPLCYNKLKLLAIIIIPSYILAHFTS
jgi:glycosyltransferase involved in cell wall biosynthesis